MRISFAVCKGATRTVLLIGRVAIKLPTFLTWKLFLYGLLGNMQETLWWNGLPDSREMMCPVLFSIPGGFLTVMRRAEPVSLEEWFANDHAWFYRAKGLSIPVEDKLDSWGRVDGRIVAVDYGSDYCSYIKEEENEAAR